MKIENNTQLPARVEESDHTIVCLVLVICVCELLIFIRFLIFRRTPTSLIIHLFVAVIVVVFFRCYCTSPVVVVIVVTVVVVVVVVGIYS